MSTYNIPIPYNLVELIRQYSNLILNNTDMPAPPSGYTNVIWDLDQFGNLAAYVPSSAITGNTPLQEAPASGVKNGTNQVFTSSQIPITSLPYQILYNGQVLFPVSDFTLTGNTWTFVNIAPISTDSVMFNYWHA